ncbi:hypothetical protein L6164_037136 [Bauhinia variegata]|uniref:Uncharacterized protein n=1 Tax=Bauhinia variegata TaxID=167791 RepID=A0ACB9KJA9_BAUVA|nr:hypothetical protein L6164_037136 [Bauhinia variegata]
MEMKPPSLVVIILTQANIKDTKSGLYPVKLLNEFACYSLTEWDDSVSKQYSQYSQSSQRTNDEKFLNAPVKAMFELQHFKEANLCVTVGQIANVYIDLDGSSMLALSVGKRQIQLIRENIDVASARIGLNPAYKAGVTNFNEFPQVVDDLAGKICAFKIIGSGENMERKLAGKTFLWRTLTAAIRSTDNIVLTVASSGIASLY